MWSFQRVLDILGRKVLLPPLNLTTVAALLPPEWEFRLVDRNARPVTDPEWDWAELVLVSAMTAHGRDPDASGQGTSDTSAGHDSLCVS